MLFNKIHIVLIFLSFFYFHYSQGQENHIPKFNEIINLDGKLDESVWKNGYLITDFKQVEPNLGEKASENPQVYLGYDEEYLYIGAIISYSDPSQMYARVLERDVSLIRDDFIEIHVDSYNDHTNSLVFSTNPLGARFDFEVSRNGDEINKTWNTFWDVSSSKHPQGWSTEIRIPFSSLRYQKSSQNTMRIKSVIKYKNSNELIMSPLLETERQPITFQYKNAEEFVLKDLPTSKPIFITPYIKGGIESINVLNETSSEFENKTIALEEKGFVNNKTLDKILSNIGLDIKYKLNPSNTLDLTLNTDFAQVEADDRIVNITRFPIFLTEKRLFFLENADLFNSNQFNHRLFHTRRIGIENGKAIPIIGGLRFTGKSNKWQYGFLSMQTNSVENELPSESMSVLRFKRTIGNRGSYIGLINTGKISNNDYNYLTAIDANIRIKENIQTQFTFATTFDKEKGNWKTMYGATLNTFKSNGFGIEYRYREYTKDFNPELGFVSRPDTKRLTLNHGWRKTYSNHSFLQRISIGNWYSKYWISSTGKPEWFQTNLYFSTTFKSGFNFGMFAPAYTTDQLFSIWNIADNVAIPAQKFTMWRFEPFFSTGNTKPYTLSGEFEFGQFYGGNQSSITSNFKYDFTKNFQAEIGATINRLKFPKEFVSNRSNTVKADIYFSRLKFAFSSNTFINSFIQYDTDVEKIGWNIRFRYTPKEGTNLYIVYNHNVNNNRERVMPSLPITDNLGFTIKYSKTFF